MCVVRDAHLAAGDVLCKKGAYREWRVDVLLLLDQRPKTVPFKTPYEGTDLAPFSPP